MLPKVDAILVLDGDGNRLAGKYYGQFLKSSSGDKSAQELRNLFEKNVHQKLANARPDSAEVVTCQGRTVVFCGNSGVRVVHVGPPGESELVLAHMCEGMYDALNNLMGGSTDRTMVLDNLELVFLLIDEHCDGGIIMEVDGHKLASAVLLRDEEVNPVDQQQMMQSNGGNVQQGLPPGVAGGDMTIGQALRQAREQFMAGMNARDGM